jgi:hypothetical protein
MKRSVSLIILGFNLGPLLNKVLDYGEMSLASSKMQRSVFVVIHSF